MKMRYYLRGLGLGILFTAIFFLIGGDSKQTMSDEMIKERAKELGMIENTVLADIGTVVEEDDIEIMDTSPEIESTMEESIEKVVTEESAMDETVEESVEESTEEVLEETTEPEAVSEESSVAEESSKEVEISKEETSQEEADSKESEENAKPTDGQIMSIMVNKGEGSDTVSQRLYEAGLVDDPYAYDKYLMQNGYDRRIGAGEHLIPSGSSWQEIAQLLCS